MTTTIQTILKPTRARGLDTSGNNNHAQIYSGRGLEFDGVTDYLVADGAASLADSDFTAAIWIKPTLDGYTGGPGGRVLFSFHDGSNNNRLIVFIAGASSGSGGSTGVANSLKTFTASNLNTASTAGALSGSWERIVLVKQGNSIQTYRNGVADGIITMADTISGSAKFSIGQEWDGSAASDFYLGMMSDFQIWNSVWTAADAEYDYLNPEQLALNRGGTSLTNSNLKLWYPMNDGHRGNQSYVLDASNVGLGDNLVTNSDFETSSANWTLVYSGGSGSGASIDAANTSSPLDGSKDLKIVNTSAGENAGAVSNGISFISGVTYKVSYKYKASASGCKGKIGHVNNSTGGSHVGGSEQQNLDNTTETDHSYIFTSTETETNYVTFIAPDGVTLQVDNVKVEPINNKNNATTVFYGDEQITDAKNRTGFASHDWVHYNSASGNINVSSSKLFITCNSSAGAGDNQGAQLAIASVDAAGGSHPIVAGRTYRVQADLDFTTIADSDLVVKFALGNASEVITASDGSPSGGTIDATEQTYYADITTADATGNLRINCTAATNDSGSDNIFSVDNVSVKEVGTAMGWTDADQQLDIPQTALQSYNQLGWFDGVERLQPGSTITPGDHTSISLWFFRNKGASSHAMGLLKAGTYGDENFRIFHKGDSIVINTYNEDDGTTVQVHTISTTINNGQWYHLGVYIPAADGGTVTAYLNGQSIGTSTMSHPMKKAAYTWLIGYNDGLTNSYAEGCITEISYFNDQLTASEFEELYNNGLALNALEHSQTANLVHYWRNDGLTTWTDLKGSNNLTGSMTQSMLITAGVDSSKDSQGFLMNRQRTTNSLNFPSGTEADLVPGYAKVSNSDTIKLTGSYTIAAWVKLPLTGNDYQRIVALETGANGTNGYGMYVHTDGKVLNACNNSNQTSASARVTADTWTYITVTADGTNRKIYTNGVQTDTETNSNDAAATTSDLFIGKSGGLSDRQVSGAIDDVILYNTALDAPEILRNYKAGKRSHK